MILLTTHKNHIKGYGFTTDLFGETIFGIPKHEVEKYLCLGYKLVAEFIEDESLPKYEVINANVPYVAIPRGQLKVWAYIPG